MKVETDEDRLFNSLAEYPRIFEEDITDLCKKIVIQKEQGKEAQPTNQTEDSTIDITGIPAPVDIISARRLKDISPHHASCIQSKKYSILGLGFISDSADLQDRQNAVSADDVKAIENKLQSLLTGESFIESKVDKILDPYTIQGFMSDAYQTVEDFLDGGTGYLEVIRNDNNRIVGINWMPYEDIAPVIVKDDEGMSRRIFEYKGGIYGTTTRYFSPFGIDNKNWVYDKFYKDSKLKKIEVSEIIPFKVPSNRSKYYGYPEWLSASSIISLLAMAMQYKSDFYTNKGVLAYMLTVLGESVSSDKWKKIESLVQGSVGAGNNWKNLAINLGNPNAKVQVDKLSSSDKTEEQFGKDLEIFAQHIVSAHRVPPVLANILIPGKLGATNEAVQALVSFQLLVIGPYQNIIQKTLARTLGGPDGIPELKPEDFRLRTITSQFNIAGLDTIGKSREEAVTATEEDGSKRDFSEGVKD